MSTPHEIPRKPLPVKKEESNAPEWEVPETGESKRTKIGTGCMAGWALSDRFDRLLPPHKRYFGRSRRTLLIAVGVIFLLLLGLIIGLAVGLTKKSKYVHLTLVA